MSNIPTTAAKADANGIVTSGPRYMRSNPVWSGCLEQGAPIEANSSGTGEKGLESHKAPSKKWTAEPMGDGNQ